MSVLARWRRVGATLFVVVALFSLVGQATPAQAHGFTTVVFVDATSPSPDQVRTRLGLEYDLLIVSVADIEKDDALYRQGQPAWQRRDYPTMRTVIEQHQASLMAYIRARFEVSFAGRPCAPTLEQSFAAGMNKNQGAPYATLTIDWACPKGSDAALHDGHVIRSALFPDKEGYIRAAQTIVTYHLDGTSGTATIDQQHPTLTTKPATAKQPSHAHHLGAGWIPAAVIAVLAVIVVILLIALVLILLRSRARRRPSQ